MTGVALRPATPADSEFCYQLHKAAMGGYITAIWGWDEQVQRDFHARAFSPGHWQIIIAGGAGIGMISVEHRPAEIYLARIELHPSQQGHGIGTQLIRALLDEAAQKGQGLVLDVLTVNYRARALYQRLGMTEVATHGDSNVKITMRSGHPGQKLGMRSVLGGQLVSRPGQGPPRRWSSGRWRQQLREHAAVHGHIQQPRPRRAHPAAMPATRSRSLVPEQHWAHPGRHCPHDRELRHRPVL